MSKVSIQYKNLLLRISSLKKRIGALFWVILLITFILDFFVIMDSVRTVLAVRKGPAVAAKSPGVRIDFNGYNFIADKIQKAPNFKTSVRVSKNPFGTK